MSIPNPFGPVCANVRPLFGVRFTMGNGVQTDIPVRTGYRVVFDGTLYEDSTVDSQFMSYIGQTDEDPRRIYYIYRAYNNTLRVSVGPDETFGRLDIPRGRVLLDVCQARDRYVKLNASEVRGTLDIEAEKPNVNYKLNFRTKPDAAEWAGGGSFDLYSLKVYEAASNDLLYDLIPANVGGVVTVYDKAHHKAYPVHGELTEIQP